MPAPRDRRAGPAGRGARRPLPDRAGSGPGRHGDGQDLRHDRKVALKVLRPDLAAVIGGERFLQEIKTTANLQHPHIDAPRSEVWLYDIPTKKAEPLIAERGDVGDGRFSPDGRWIAYRSNADGEDQVYLRAFPGPGRAIRVSPTGGRLPRWRGDGRELFYLDGTRIMAVGVRDGGILGTTAPAIRASTSRIPGVRTFEPTPDGQRFAFVFDTGASPGLTLVLNWWSLLKGER